jgi:hypothetical protein
MKQYILWYEKAQGEPFMVLQLRGDYPYAHIVLTKQEVVELIGDLQIAMENWEA